MQITNNLPPDILAKAAKFEKLTGNSLELHKNEDGEITKLSNSAQTNFLLEFLKTGVSSPEGILAAIESLAQRYAELREEIIVSDDNYYQRLDHLNQAFEQALHATTLMPLPQLSQTAFLSANSQQIAQAQTYEAMKKIMRYVQDSLARGIDTFFENFIKTGDFTQSLPNSGISSNLATMSFADAVLIRDTVSHWTTQQDADGNETAILRDLRTSFSMIIREDAIALPLRSEIAEMLGMTISTSAPPTYAQLLAEGMMNGTGNGNPDFVGSPLQILNAKLFNLSIAFGEMSSQGLANNPMLQGAFRNLVFSLFDDTAVAVHGEDAAARAEARDLANSFLNRFFYAVRIITGQNLQDTRMVRTELAFHEAMNYVCHEIGMAVLGGSEASAGNVQDRGMTEEERRRLQMLALLKKIRLNAEVMQQWAEASAEERERWRKIILIASRIAAGDNVTAEERAFLAQHSPGMYMLVRMAQREDYDPQGV